MQKNSGSGLNFQALAANSRFIHNPFHKEVSLKNLLLISKVERYFFYGRISCFGNEQIFSINYIDLNLYFVTETKTEFSFRIFCSRFGQKLCKNLLCMKSYSSSKICIQTFFKSARIQSKMFSLIWLFLLCYDQFSVLSVQFKKKENIPPESTFTNLYIHFIKIRIKIKVTTK